MKFVKIPHQGTLVGLYRTFDKSDFVTTEVQKLSLTLAGIPGDRHSGFHKSAGVREKNLYPKGTPIANHRQWSALSVEELDVISKKMGLEDIAPSFIGANFLIEGIPFLTQLPPLTRLRIGNGKLQSTLVVYEENLPCKFPEEEMRKAGLQPNGDSFPIAALNRRGVVGWVENGGRIMPGDKVDVLIPIHWSDKINQLWPK